MLWYHHFTHAYQKSQSYDVRFLRYRVRQTNFLSFWVIFCPLPPPIPPNDPKNKNFEKKKKKCLESVLLYILVYHKWRSYDIWFLTYTVQQTEIFIILPFQPFDNLEDQNFNIEENTWRYYHFTHLHHEWHSYDQGVIQGVFEIGNHFWVHKNRHPNFNKLTKNKVFTKPLIIKHGAKNNFLPCI